MNSGRTIDLKAATFTKPNSLIYRSNEPTHRIINFKEPERNIELKMMVLERQAVFNTKKGAIHQFLVAD